MGLALTSQGLPWVAESSGMVVWAAPVDKGDCCRGCFISVEHDPVGIHIFLLGREGEPS